MKIVSKALVLLLLATMSVYVAAAEEVAPADDGVPEQDGEPLDEGARAAAKAIYLPLKPAFVVNYGGAGRLKYIKAEVSVRLDSSRAANSVRHHMPYIRNNLVMLFASQTDESVGSQAGKEALRQDALAEIRKILLEEDRQEGVIDVFFNTLIVQK